MTYYQAIECPDKVLTQFVKDELSLSQMIATFTKTLINQEDVMYLDNQTLKDAHKALSVIKDVLENYMKKSPIPAPEGYHHA